MDFYTNPAKIKVLRIIVLCASIALLLINAYRIVESASDDYFTLIPPILFIVLMAIQIRKTKSDSAITPDSTT